jgi:hypothetical protein
MPRVVGLAMQYGGNFPMTYGLGHNGLEEVAFYTKAEISLDDFPCTEITLADSGPLACIETSDAGALTHITAASAGALTSIGLDDRPATIITSADGKDG